MKYLSWFAVMVLFASTASALSLSIPQDRHFTFEPYINITVVFQVQNNDGVDQEVSFYANGELSEYVRFEPTNKVVLQAGEAYAFAAIFELPAQIPPGEHVPVIGASGKRPNSQATIGATTAVQVRVFIRGRHEGKLVRPILTLFPQAAGEPMRAEVEYQNIGSQAIEELAARLDVLDKQGRLVGPLNLPSVAVPYDGVEKVEGKFDTKGMAKGAYLANLTMILDGLVLGNAASQEFRLGEREVLITGHTGRLEQGLELVRFNVSSDWNQVIEDVFVVAELPKGGGMIARFQSPTVDLKPFQTFEFEGYLDVNNATLGTTIMKAKVHYTSEDLKREYSLPVNIVRKGQLESPRMFTDQVVLALVGLVIVLIVMNLFWFVYIQRQRKGDLH